MPRRAWTKPELCGPSGELLVRPFFGSRTDKGGKSTKRFCACETEKGAQSFVVRRSSATGTVVRRVMIRSIDHVLEVKREGVIEVALVGDAGPVAG